MLNYTLTSFQQLHGKQYIIDASDDTTRSGRREVIGLGGVHHLIDPQRLQTASSLHHAVLHTSGGVTHLPDFPGEIYAVQ